MIGPRFRLSTFATCNSQNLSLLLGQTVLTAIEWLPELVISLSRPISAHCGQSAFHSYRFGLSRDFLCCQNRLEMNIGNRWRYSIRRPNFRQHRLTILVQYTVLAQLPSFSSYYRFFSQKSGPEAVTGGRWHHLASLSRPYDWPTPIYYFSSVDIFHMPSAVLELLAI